MRKDADGKAKEEQMKHHYSSTHGHGGEGHGHAHGFTNGERESVCENEWVGERNGVFKKEERERKNEGVFF